MKAPIRKRGLDLLRDPLLNKGSAFDDAEREAFGLHGILPPQVSSLEQQAERAWAQVQRAEAPLARYGVLSALHDRNETLYYRVLQDHLTELMPIVYTPTVGAATQHYSRVHQRGRGLWITPACRGRMQDMLRIAADGHEVRLIVATDNEAILGIGDQGAGGMAISVGKLALYVAGAGIPPWMTLPVSLDVGTDNQELLDDPLYLGWREPRLRGADYDSLVEEFVVAVGEVFPQALLQWEDFRKDNALRLMERYRERILSFNDDIQGTGAVALAGMLSGLRVTGTPLNEVRVLIYGAGAAGLGIARQIKAALMEAGLSERDARHRLAMMDSGGLIVQGRARLDAYKEELAWDEARAISGDLAAVAERFQPHVLIGSSGQPGAFSEEVVRTMARHVDQPIILPFSNPTDRAEATPADLLAWTDGRALVATGSPFAPVEHAGRKVEIGQGNNVFIFPGLGLGALSTGATRITNAMVTAAASALAQSVSDEELARGLLFPDVRRLKSVSQAVAEQVGHSAQSEGTARHAPQFESWQPVYARYEMHASE